MGPGPRRPGRVGGGGPNEPQPIVPERTTIQLLLLRQKSVQKELKLADDVAKKVMEFTNKESRGVRQSAEAGRRRSATQKFEELEKENKKFLEENLSAEQRKRLEQITLQVTGLHAAHAAGSDQGAQA